MTRSVAIGMLLCAAIAAACNSTGGATSAPTGPAATPAVTAAPPTTSPPTGAPTAAPGAAAAVFKPKAGGTPTVEGGAKLTAVDGKTQVIITVTSSSTEALAASIQAGTCDALNPEIAYRLADVTGGASSTTVAVSLETLLATPYSINISVLGSETESSITCGEIKIAPAS